MQKWYQVSRGFPFLVPFLQARMKKYIKKPQKHKHAADENANSSLEIRQLLYGPLQDGKKKA